MGAIAMLTILEFARLHIDTRVKSRGGIGGQCVDLVELWAVAQGKEPIRGNAVDLYANANRSEWLAVPNGPVNSPPCGAVVVWGPWSPSGISPLGHTAVALIADEHSLLVLGQNWPSGAPVRFTLMRYGGCLGWLIPRLSPGPSHLSTAPHQR